MCHLVVALHAHPDFPFIVASNRDEFSDRPFGDPVLHEDGILCGIDQPSAGTWLGVHAQRGHFAALTNIGGRGGRGGIRRGQLTLDFVRDPRAAQHRLAASMGARGFNLLWCDDIRASRPQLQYASNCNPDDRGGSGTPAITTIEAEPGDGGVVMGLGNDLLGDEHVKSPFLERRVRALLDSRAVAASRTNQALAAAAADLRDDLGQMLCHRSLGGYSPYAIAEKFLRWSSHRRLQPGTRTALIAGSLLAGIAAMWPGAPLSMIGLGGAMGLSLGLGHHLRMQHIFVDVPAGKRRWTTVAQTVVVVDRKRTIHYFARRTVDGPAAAAPWIGHSFERPGDAARRKHEQAIPPITA